MTTAITYMLIAAMVAAIIWAIWTSPYNDPEY